jgi:hypothetical protein
MPPEKYNARGFAGARKRPRKSKEFSLSYQKYLFANLQKRPSFPRTQRGCRRESIVKEHERSESTHLPRFARS